MLNDSEVMALRRRFPVFKKKIYLNSCSQGALSDTVQAGMRAYLDSWLELGTPWDVWGIARIAHERGALVFLDDFQDCGTRLVDVKPLDVDFYVTGTLKYLLGPSGLAFLYIREELIERLVPTVTGWFAQRNIFAFETKVYDPAPTARRFETGTPPIPAIYAALPALELLEGIGMAKVAAQVEKLTQAFVQGVHDLDIETKTPPNSVGPLVVLRAADAGRGRGAARRAQHSHLGAPRRCALLLSRL